VNSISYREDLYEIFINKHQSVENKIHCALQLGTEYLDLPIGFFTRIDQDIQEIVQVVGEHPLIQPGGSCPLDEAYCRRTIERESPLAVENSTVSVEISETAIETFGLGTYIGAKVVVGDDSYGTVCFADENERATPFTDSETHFIELLAHLIGNAIEREAHTREIDERDEIQRALVDASFDLVFRFDPDGRFVFISEPVEDVLGYTPEELVGRPFTDLIPDEELVEQATETFEQALSGRSIEEEYLVIESKSGNEIVFDVRKVPLYESSVPKKDQSPTDIVGVLGAAKVATERFQREQLNHVLNRVLRHNLRNDMNVISGFSGELVKRLEGENAGLAKRITETSDRLMSLSESARKLDENLDLNPELEPMNIAPVIERAADQITERYPDANITVTLPDELVGLSTLSLETAVWELLDNAAKHAGNNPEISIEATTTKDRVEIRITDDGPGLPPSERLVLTTGKETPLIHGQGLGLWLVYWIIQSLNGELTLADRSVGTSIELQLDAGEITTDFSAK